MRREWSSRRAAVTLSALLIVAAVAITAASAAFASNDKAAAKPDIAYAKAQIAKFSKVPGFVPPGPAFDASKLKGKTFFEIPVTSAIPFVTNVESGMKAVADQYGIKYVGNPNQGQPTQWVQAMNLAIARKADGISLFGPNPKQLQPQILSAKRAGIPVVTAHLFDTTDPQPPNVTSDFPAQYSKIARLEVDWVIQDTGGKANVVIINSADYPPSNGIVATMKDEFKRRCGPSCTFSVINVPLNNWATGLQPATQSALAKNPNVNYIIPIYDGMMQWVAPAIITAGRVGKVHVATFNATPFVLTMMKKQDIVRCDIGESPELGWAMMDLNMRVMLGLRAPRPEPYGIRVFTKKNVAQAGSPPSYTKGYGSAYVAGYHKLWAG
ncbi:MAG TPA: substrate-binding domain-containing protein [Gaiellaceae bacterium]|nr:substrate-binding domain-containing protein [Gaiellaceae bacterium]